MCSTKALLVGDAESVSNVIRARVMARGGKEMNSSYGWNIAYKNK
jgi:formate dehydrogenase iron-sulfur subunit